MTQSSTIEQVSEELNLDQIHVKAVIEFLVGFAPKEKRQKNLAA